MPSLSQYYMESHISTDNFANLSDSTHKPQVTVHDNSNILLLLLNVYTFMLYVCMYECVCVCMCMYVYACMYACMHSRMHESVYVCVHACMCVYVCMYV